MLQNIHMESILALTLSWFHIHRQGVTFSLSQSKTLGAVLLQFEDEELTLTKAYSSVSNRQ